MNVTLAPYLEQFVVAQLRQLRITDWIGDREININWSTQADSVTGVVTVTPSFPMNLTQSERQTLEQKGYVAKTICTFGPLVQLIPDSCRVMIPTLNQLGISLSLLSIYVLKEDAPTLRAQMSQLFRL